MGYKDWIAKVAKVALRLQALRKYRPKGANQTKTWFIKGQGTIVPQIYSFARDDAILDGEGVTKMGGINALSSGLNHKKKGEAKNMKPMATWKTVAEYNRLRENKLCTRCSKPGHYANRCPSFLPALPPKARLNATEVEDENQSENEEP
ncbi:hypothetical protein K3495_g13834 [Podosphaera aphanis]|nr:hypothetical protein K3495_g13834 [Podosphaera aphanis]